MAEKNITPEELAHLTLEHLKHLRNAVDRLENDVRDVKFRVRQVEETLTHHTGRFDRIDDRLQVIEKRLGLVEV